MPILHGSHRGSLDKALDPGGARGPKHPERPLDGGTNQHLLVFRLAYRKGRGDMQYVRTAGESLVPSRV
jgi:hypothetical protein